MESSISARAFPSPRRRVGAGIAYFNQRADLTCNPATGAPHTAAQWFTPDCFAIPGTENGGTANPFIPGTAPAYLDHVRTMGARDLDLSLYKTFSFGENAGTALRGVLLQRDQHGAAWNAERAVVGGLSAGCNRSHRSRPRSTPRASSSLARDLRSDPLAGAPLIAFFAMSGACREYSTKLLRQSATPTRTRSRLSTASPFSRSAIRSSTCSRPTERRIICSVTPIFFRNSGSIM